MPLQTMDRRIPKNPKYSEVASVVDSGPTTRKVTHITTREYLKRRDELFRRVKPLSLYHLLVDNEEKVESIYDIPEKEEAKSAPVVVTGADESAEVHDKVSDAAAHVRARAGTVAALLGLCMLWRGQLSWGGWRRYGAPIRMRLPLSRCAASQCCAAAPTGCRRRSAVQAIAAHRRLTRPTPPHHVNAPACRHRPICSTRVCVCACVRAALLDPGRARGERV